MSKCARIGVAILTYTVMILFVYDRVHDADLNEIGRKFETQLAMVKSAAANHMAMSKRVLWENGKENDQNVTIVMWTPYYGYRQHLFANVSQLSLYAPLPSWCNASFDRSLIDQADAIVFSGLANDLKTNDLPPRRQDQLWTWHLVESPAYYSTSRSTIDRMLFNLTMDYRLTSDVPSPYGTVVEDDNGDVSVIKTEEQFNAIKTPIAWMVSNCGASNQRMRCYKNIAPNYLFYLSFENSNCPGYITEKFTNALYAGMIPIVYGGSNMDYDGIIAHNLTAYIRLRDFSSVTNLVTHLKAITSNYTLYKTYHEWRGTHIVRTQQVNSGFKNLCHYVRDRRRRGDVTPRYCT